MAPLGKQIAHLLHQVALVLRNLTLELLARPHHDFGGRRRRGRAQVRDEIRDREIRFVADCP